MTPRVRAFATTTPPLQHIVIEVYERPMPSPGSLGAAWRSSPRAREYARWRGIQRDLVRVILTDVDAWPVPADWILGAAFSFGAALGAPLGSRRRKDGQVDRRFARDVLAWDLRNLQKAVEDVMQGLLWHDDRQVRFAGPGAAFDTRTDWWSIHAWAASPDAAFDARGRPRMGWKSEWEEMSVPYLVRSERMEGG